jgi:putative ATP-grasp target RiPP
MAAPARLDRSARNGLAPIGSQFPLARPVFDLPSADDVPASAAEPFGMRFFRPVAPVQDMSPVPYRYNAVLQVAVTDDGTDTPLITLPIAWDRTTTGGADGNGPGVEEWTMDYAGDQ